VSGAGGRDSRRLAAGGWGRRAAAVVGGGGGLGDSATGRVGRGGVLVGLRGGVGTLGAVGQGARLGVAVAALGGGRVGGRRAGGALGAFDVEGVRVLEDGRVLLQGDGQAVYIVLAQSGVDSPLVRASRVINAR